MKIMKEVNWASKVNIAYYIQLGYHKTSQPHVMDREGNLTMTVHRKIGHNTACVNITKRLLKCIKEACWLEQLILCMSATVEVTAIKLGSSIFGCQRICKCKNIYDEARVVPNYFVDGRIFTSMNALNFCQEQEKKYRLLQTIPPTTHDAKVINMLSLTAKNSI